ncbi:hypothetical protein [Alteribacillus sp. YIM 98480]|nr:hypothetical protein [Alteribacillus sp. YIM 98480]
MEVKEYITRINDQLEELKKKEEKEIADFDRSVFPATSFSFKLPTAK